MQPESDPQGGRWRIVGLAATLTTCLATTVLFMFALAALGPFLITDLGIDRTAFGAITGAMFLTAAVAAPRAGALVDGLGPRRVLLGVFALAATGLVGAALSPAYPLLLVAAVAAGLALTTGNSVTNRLVAAHVPSAAQGTLMGVAYSGAQVSALLTGAALPLAALAVGWRGALLLSAFIPLLGIAGAMMAVPSHPPHSEQARATRTHDRELIRWMSAYAFLMGCGATGVPSYLALFAVDDLQLTPATGGLAVACLGLAGILGRVWWSRQTHAAHNPAVTMAWLAGCSCAIQLGLLAAALTGAAWLLWPAALLFGLIPLSWMPVAMIAVVAATPFETAGRAAGRVQRTLFVGAAVTPPALGLLIDVQGHYRGAWLALTATFALATLAAWRPARSETIRLSTDAMKGA